jgi:lipopolysaccharide export system protein LptA
LLFCLLLLLAAPLQAQNTRTVELSANSLVGYEQAGGRVNRLLGNVQLRQGETRLWANEAIDTGQDDLLFTGNVLIVERGDSLRADRVLYNKRTKTGQASGHVRLSDGEVVVQAPSGLYFTEEKRARFTEGVTLIDSTSVLESAGGEYFSDEKRAEFYGAIRLWTEQTFLEADSITYFRETEVSIARGHVFIRQEGGGDTAEADSTTRTFLFSDWAWNDNLNQTSRLRGQPLLVRVRADTTGTPTDTLIIRAGVIEALRPDSTLQRLVATDSVRIWQQEFAAVADSVVSERWRLPDLPTREESRLYHNPMAWFEQTQVNGDTLRILTRDGGIDSLFVRANTFVALFDTLLQRTQQLRGQHLVGLFRNDSLHTLHVGPNAETIYFLKNEDQAPDGAVQASSDRVTFYFAGGELQDFKFFTDVEGTLYSEELLPQPFRLTGFSWRPDERPTKPSLLMVPGTLERLAASPPSPRR